MRGGGMSTREAFEKWMNEIGNFKYCELTGQELCWEAWQAAMESQASEPVAWMYKDEPSFDGDKWHDKYNVTTSHQVAKFKDSNCKPLYTSPPNTPYDVGKSYAQLADRLQAKLDKAREALKLYARRGWETGWEHAVQTLKEIE
jgi:hypothetical protein